VPAPYPSALTTEVGSPGGLSGAGGRWTVDDSYEEAVDLRWPNSVRVFDLMWRTDGQTNSVVRAIGLPIRQTRWAVTGSNVDPRVRALVEAELGLQVDEEGRRRTSGMGFSFDEHLRTALLSLVYGFMPFEQVYALGPPPASIPGLPPVLAHLRKLAPRMPRTLLRVDVAADGGLAGVTQLVPRGGYLTQEVTIGTDRLVMYANERVGADWYGTSILRSAFKHWLLKEQTLRLMAVAAERNSLGVPVVTYPAGGSRAEALAIGKRFRAGEEAAVAQEEGYSTELLGVTGSTIDLLPHLRWHDESIGRSALAMFLNLGHDRGARSLGDTFLDFFTLAENAIVAHLEEVLTEHVVRDLVAVNFGPDEPYPTIKADEIVTGGPLAADAISTLVREGVIIPDLDLEAHIRRQGNLPPSMRAEAAGPIGPIESLPQPVEELPGRPPPMTAAASGARSAAELGARLETVRARLAAYRAAEARQAPRPAA